MPKLSPNCAKNGHFSELFCENFAIFSRVETSSAKARKTRLDSNFVKSQLPKLAKTKISVKTVFAGPYHNTTCLHLGMPR